MGMILITHDLGVVAETADRVSVMYAGRIVESGTVRQILKAPQHPYTQGLLLATPHAPRGGRGGRRRQLAEIPGLVPSLFQMPPGCAFAPRCPRAADICRTAPPPLESLEEANLSEMARGFYAENRRVANGKARRVLGWAPKYPTYVEGLAALLQV